MNISKVKLANIGELVINREKERERDAFVNQGKGNRK